MLELEFLKKVDWQIVPEPTVLEAYYKSMISQDPRYYQEGDTTISHLDSLKVGKTRSLSDSMDDRSSKILRRDLSMSE